MKLSNKLIAYSILDATFTEFDQFRSRRRVKTTLLAGLCVFIVILLSALVPTASASNKQNIFSIDYVVTYQDGRVKTYQSLQTGRAHETTCASFLRGNRRLRPEVFKKSLQQFYAIRGQSIQVSSYECSPYTNQ